jgi:hypothetical protein
MKTNFKKLALMAGVSAAMAGGSMSAHAVIQAVPAPAALVPYVKAGNGGYDNDSLACASGGQSAETIFRIEVPSSVGLDAVVNLFGGPNVVNGTIPESGVATGLSGSVPTGSTPASSKLHWIFMNKKSVEVDNASFPVSANDVYQFSTSAMPRAGRPANKNFEGAGIEGEGYLVIINESALLGGAPLFSFQVDAHLIERDSCNVKPVDDLIDVEGRGGVVVNNIPVYPLSDAADTNATAPTLKNNVVENISDVPAALGYGSGPIVSPIISGIRFAASQSDGTPEEWLRVIDFPVTNDRGEKYVVWSDRNGIENIVNGSITRTPALSGNILTYDCDENPDSGTPLSFKNQLNILKIYNPIKSASMGSSYGVEPEYVSAGNSMDCFYKSDDAGKQGKVGGFVRWLVAPGVNIGKIKSAAYQAGVIFRLRQSSYDGYSQFPVDRGFFTGR